METNNKSKKISEFRALNSLIPMGSNKSNTWFLAAFYNQNNNTYSNIAISLDAITNYCNSYTSYHISYFDKLLENQKYEIKDILNSYLDNMSYQIVDVPISYITSYCATYTSYIISNEVQKISNNMVNLVSKIKNNNNSSSSYFRSNSKKISELTARETITYHKDHSWIPLAQYDSRVNAYVNLAMNLDTITSYCNSYSSYINTYNSYILDNKITYLQEHIEGPVSNNIISYAFSYSKDYFEWQFL